jgi:flagellar motor switch protein FliN/FliY
MTATEEIAHLADVSIEIGVELDRCIMTIAGILELREGSIIRMTRSAGENIDILAGGSRLGYGEIVIMENAMGVRITDFDEDE